jgi:hypothetical protein
LSYAEVYVSISLEILTSSDMQYYNLHTLPEFTYRAMFLNCKAERKFVNSKQENRSKENYVETR